MNKKIGALVLALGLMQVGGTAIAEPAYRAPFTLDLACLRHNGTISPGVVPAGQKAVVFGPYTAKCAKLAHIFRFSAASTNHAVVEQLINGQWRVVVRNQMNINHPLGSGTFQVRIDNSKGPFALPYQATFSVPF